MSDDRIHYDDVDDVVEASLRAKDAQEDLLSVQDVKAIGEDLDLSPELIEQGIAVVKKQRAQEDAHAQQAQLAAQRRRVLLGRAALALLATLGLMLAAAGISLASTRSALTSASAEVDAQRALVELAQQKQARTLARYANKPDSRDKEVALAGAENRVFVQMRRYDDVVKTYNQRAASFPASLWAPLLSLKTSLPTASKTFDQSSP